jgi:hypothetical protein
MLRSVRGTPAASNIRVASRTDNVWLDLRSEAFRRLRKRSESFRTVPNVSEAFGIVPKLSEPEESGAVFEGLLCMENLTGSRQLFGKPAAVLCTEGNLVGAVVP